jgi:Na+/H+ antiporter NhaC
MDIFEAICEELTAMFACVLIISLPFQHIFPIHDPLIISRRIATGKDATTPVKKQQALFLFSLFFLILPLSHSFLHFLPLSLTAASKEVIYYISYFFKRLHPS